MAHDSQGLDQASWGLAWAPLGLAQASLGLAWASLGLAWGGMDGRMDRRTETQLKLPCVKS